MKTVLSSLAIVIFAGLLSAEKVTLSGYLIDRECAPGIIEQGKEASANHDRSCALMDLCAQSGFGVLTSDGKFVTFDDPGNEKAIAAIENASKDKDYQVTVSGERQGDEIKVESLKLD